MTSSRKYINPARSSRSRLAERTLLRGFRQLKFNPSTNFLFSIEEKSKSPLIGNILSVMVLDICVLVRPNCREDAELELTSTFMPAAGTHSPPTTRLPQGDQEPHRLAFQSGETTTKYGREFIEILNP